VTLSKRDDLLRVWDQAIDNETFLTSKHDPKSVGTSLSKYRTVTVMEAPGLKTFFQEGNFTIRQYENNNPTHSDDYFQIVPKDTSVAAGSGIEPHSPTCSHPCDSFVAVSGANQGWHRYAEESANIQAKETSGDLKFIVELL
jgi:hypothetical protein